MTEALAVSPTPPPTRPVLRYHGGKWRLSTWIISHFPEHRIYVEPFGGAMSVLLKKPRSYSEVVNDVDDNVVDVFRVLRDTDLSSRLETVLRLTPFSRTEYEACWDLPPATDLVEKARRIILRSHAGFGAGASLLSLSRRARTGFRGNSNRSHTTPAHDWANYPDQVERFCARLRGVVIENRDWRKVIAQHDKPDVLFYLDPPYLMSTRSRTDHGYQYELKADDHVELAAVLHRVAGAVVLSGYDSELYADLYRDWKKVTRLARTDGHGAPQRTECLWIREAAA